MDNKQTENNLDQLQREHASANVELQKLLDERTTMNARLAQASAAEVIDAKTIISLQTRADELPKFIYVAELKARRARIAVLELNAAESAAEAQTEIVAVHEHYERFQEAQRLYNEATWKRDNARAAASGDRTDLANERLELEKFIRSNAPSHAPLVRSIPHAA